MDMNNLKFISIVIPSHNRINKLKNCLTSVEHMDYPKDYFEVIVIDDGSTDSAYKNLEEIRKQFSFDLKIVRQPNGGPATARNKGIKMAKGEFIAFTDDDCEVDKNWIREIICGFKSEVIVGVGGTVVSKNNDIITKYINYNRILLPRIENNKIMYLVTANACYRKKSLIDVNGFSEEIKNPGGEDPDLSFKLLGYGSELVFKKESIVIHNHKLSIISFYRMFNNYGRGSAYLIKKWGKLAGTYETINASLMYLFFDFSFLYQRVIFFYREGMGLRQSLVFGILDHVRKIARVAGLRQGY